MPDALDSGDYEGAMQGWQQLVPFKGMHVSDGLTVVPDNDAKRSQEPGCDPATKLNANGASATTSWRSQTQVAEIGEAK